MGTTLRHRTTYSYATPVRLGPQLLRLLPQPEPRRPAPQYDLRICPEPSALHILADCHGNHVARFTLAAPLDALRIEIDLHPDLSPRNPFDFLLADGAEHWPLTYPAEEHDALDAYLRPQPAGGAMHALRALTPDACPTVELLTGLGARVRDRIRYVVRDEPGTWGPDATLAAGEGSCRDLAWLLVQLLRMHGMPARFVSGYLVQESAGELHAWAEAYLPGAGWIGIDATSGYLTAEAHIPLAAAPDPAGAAPLTGTSEPTASRLETRITVRRE